MTDNWWAEERPVAYFNYRTGERDWHTGVMTDELAVQYIPQYEAVQTMYRMLRVSGQSIQNAFIKVLELWTGRTI